jgi:hypothetical protein
VRSQAVSIIPHYRREEQRPIILGQRVETHQDGQTEEE